MLSIFCAPSRYVQGRDATYSLGQEMAKLGLTGHHLWHLIDRNHEDTPDKIDLDMFTELVNNLGKTFAALAGTRAEGL